MTELQTFPWGRRWADWRRATGAWQKETLQVDERHDTTELPQTDVYESPAWHASTETDEREERGNKASPPHTKTYGSVFQLVKTDRMCWVIKALHKCAICTYTDQPHEGVTSRFTSWAMLAIGQQALWELDTMGLLLVDTWQNNPRHWPQDSPDPIKHTSKA